ncbi:MAG: hypothetical protein GPJ51_09170 [Candidatus Heimdallarchaeota archaeon]|nr:hypothetical protein [Candidatus Heimdallarchaeota archaeon]
MKKNVLAILALFLLTFSSFTLTAQPPEWSEIIGLGYSDKIVPGTEISWELTTFETTDPAAENWEIYPGHNLTVGDVFNLNVTKDPDEMGLTHPAILYTGSESWSDFYLNDVFITDNISNVDWRVWKRDERLYAGYIVPTTITFASGEVNYFDYLYDYYSELDYDEDGSLKVKKTDKTFTIEEEYKAPPVVIFSGGAAKLSYTYYSKLTYNVEWGVGVYLELIEKSSTIETRVVLETGIDEIAVPYEWLYGLFALLIMGLVTIKKKK